MFGSLRCHSLNTKLYFENEVAVLVCALRSVAATATLVAGGVERVVGTLVIVTELMVAARVVVV